MMKKTIRIKTKPNGEVVEKEIKNSEVKIFKKELKGK